MSWRLYAKRPFGAWLDTDVQMSANLTWGINGASRATATLPSSGVRRSPDAYPFWYERGTELYAESDGLLQWCGVLDWAKPVEGALNLEFKGLSSVYDLIRFDGRISAWDPNPYDVVQLLLNNAHAQPAGNPGFVVVRDGDPVRTAGDPKPDVPRPPKPPRKAGETRDDYDDRLLTWEEAVDAWEALYGGREPYSLGWWEAQYVGDEIRELADEIPFTVIERHAWVDRAALTARHELVLATELTERVTDVALLEGVNVTSVLEPETDTTVYGNHAVILGAGEGSGMVTAELATDDGRYRTTRVADMKTVKQLQRLQAAAATLQAASRTSVNLKAAQVSPQVARRLRLGDEVRVVSKRFTGWCRISEITASTLGGPYDLEFDRTSSGELT